MSETLKERLRAKLTRQLAEDGPPDPEQEDTRQVSVQDDLDLVNAVADDDPVLEELASRYLVP
ncbi:hypothetical protein [Nocardia sp. NBC_00511]|uniref:hypothetical protein n=1 Tax=Nocardia sp. NBC_00511 TaxID=2903591 RepID=UPI0030DDF6C1